MSNGTGTHNGLVAEFSTRLFSFYSFALALFRAARLAYMHYNDTMGVLSLWSWTNFWSSLFFFFFFFILSFIFGILEHIGALSGGKWLGIMYVGDVVI
jgi:hypothetical protein